VKSRKFGAARDTVRSVLATKVGKKKHEVSFPPDAEVEDTSLRDSLRFLATKKRCTKEKGTDTFPSQNGKQYKYPRPLMHLRLRYVFV